LGNHGYLKKGDVQWMTSGSGIIHSEGPTENFSNNGGTMELIQLWVNLPKKNKLTPPRYQQINSADMPQVFSQNKNIVLRLVSGTYNDLKGPVNTFSKVTSFMGFISGEDEIKLAFSAEENTLLYLLNGNIIINGTEVRANQCIFSSNNGTEINIQGNDQAKFLLLSGEKLNEPMVSYGPFVMNTEQELIDAVNDYNSGKMGILNS
jgi:redox-sensitive bicupin YhaK (pirin superfamily)